MRKFLAQFLTSAMLLLMIAIGVTIVSFWEPVQPVLAEPNQPHLIGALFSFSGNRPDNLGIENGHLNPCPESPNCVFSESLDSDHQIDPLTYQGTDQETFENLKMVIETLDNAKIIVEDNPYLYAEFTIPIFGFVDDVEFYIDSEHHQIQVRSASRLGESDLGVNRRRVETIRAMFESLNT